MDRKWTLRILKATLRENSDVEEEFLSLVDEVEGYCTLEVARVLMKTFSDRADFGTQESVVSVLASTVDKDVTQAILEELPRLVCEAPEWAETLIGAEVDQRPELLFSVAKSMPTDVKDSLRHLLESKSFRDYYPIENEINI